MTRLNQRRADLGVALLLPLLTVIISVLGFWVQTQTGGPPRHA
jgi:hypothetical protein